MDAELEHGLRHLTKLAMPLTILLWVSAIGCVPVLAWAIKFTFDVWKIKADLKYISMKTKELEKMSAELALAAAETHRCIQDGTEKTLECIERQAEVGASGVRDIAHYLKELTEHATGKRTLPPVPGE